MKPTYLSSWIYCCPFKPLTGFFLSHKSFSVSSAWHSSWYSRYFNFTASFLYFQSIFRLSDSIHRLISAYDLTNLDSRSFHRNPSWCSGYSGHLIVLSYLSHVLPEYKFNIEPTLSSFISSWHLEEKSDLYFCCGLSGIYASFLYISLQHRNSLPPSFDPWLSALKEYITSNFSSSLSRSSYELMKPSLLDGFSIFPILASNSTNHLSLLESILLFIS